MKIKNYKQSEKGFALALALIMLFVMSLMGATLVMVAASDHKKNATKDSSKQAFYAAETGITEAKKWLAAQSSLSANNDPNSKLKFCKTSSFSNLSSTKAINNYVESKSLDQIISVSGDEKKRLEKKLLESLNFISTLLSFSTFSLLNFFKKLQSLKFWANLPSLL